MPVICLYALVDTLFKNNLKNLKITDIILLTLTSAAILSKEDTEKIKGLLEELTKRKIVGYVNLVKKVLKSLKNLSNIVLKQERVVIQNLEEFLHYRSSIKIINLVTVFSRIHKVRVKDFAYWYIVDQRNQISYDLIEYVNVNLE